MIMAALCKVQQITIIMSLTEQSLSEKQFFSFYYSAEGPPESLFPPLRQKYRAYRQQSYYTGRPISEVNFVRKFEQVCQYVCFVGAVKAQKMEIALIQQLIEEVLDDFTRFFAEGGWKAVKNKSHRCRLQEYLLLKLARHFTKHRNYGTLDNFLLSFFYTLNYFKTCNYEIKLFSQFLLAHADLDYFFLFIILRKRSRRHHRDLVIKSEHIVAIVSVLKSELPSPAHGISLYASENDDLGEVKLLLIFPEIAEYVKANAVVLHEVMIYNLMRCAGLTQEQNPLELGKLNWSQFLTSYFSQVCAVGSSYPQALVEATVTANLKLADRLFPPDLEMSRMTFSDSGETPLNIARERYLQQSFGFLIGALEGVFYGGCENELWKRLFAQGSAVHDHGLFVGRKLIREIMRSSNFFELYRKHSSKAEISVE